MASPSPDDLVSRLPGLDPAVLKALDAQAQQALLAAIKAAEKQQDRDYADALDESLKHVPALLRKTIRKMITG
ncbi:MAG: hypothetical protein REI12_03485 [Pedobacter sp.]|nr:hypothetical protein [Pedobacter sp.]